MIPDWLTEKLASLPEAGTGLHAWLFSCARQLHAHMDSAAVGAVLSASTARAGRRVPGREIRDAVRNSAAVAWQRKDFSGGVEREKSQHRNAKGDGLTSSEEEPQSIRPKELVYSRRGNVLPAENPWPKLDPVARRARVADTAADGVAGLVDLWERSPVLPDWGADDWIDWLFPGAEWLCLATDHPATARTRRREKWSFGPADECGLIVPSPMTGPSGKTLGGQRSHRCLDNTGPRRWLVIEFDSGSIDEQAALHWHLRASALAAGWPRLALCVHSAGKSLHGWYGLCDESSGDEERARELMGYAAGLGADTATWNRCQLVRLPGGVRRVKQIDTHWPDGWEAPGERQRLEVFFFDPGI